MPASAAEGDEDLRAAKAAVAAHRRQAECDPSAYAPKLARSLHILSHRLSDAGRQEDALDAIDESVDLYRALVEEHPAAHAEHLASALNTQSSQLSMVGRHEEALRAIEESAAVFRGLAETDPAAHTEHLAIALHNFSGRLSEVGRQTEGLQAIEEAVRHFRLLAESAPVTHHISDLASALATLSNRLLEVGCPDESLRAGEESVAIHRGLAESGSRVEASGLAASLNNMAGTLANLGKTEAAERALNEATGILRELAADDYAAYARQLAQALLNLSIRLSKAGDHDGALRAAYEAIDIRRDLAEASPAVHASDYAQSMRHLWDLQAEHKSPLAVHDAAREEIDEVRETGTLCQLLAMLAAWAIQHELDECAVWDLQFLASLPAAGLLTGVARRRAHALASQLPHELRKELPWTLTSEASEITGVLATRWSRRIGQKDESEFLRAHQVVLAESGIPRSFEHIAFMYPEDWKTEYMRRVVHAAHRAGWPAEIERIERSNSARLLVTEWLQEPYGPAKVAFFARNQEQLAGNLCQELLEAIARAGDTEAIRHGAMLTLLTRRIPAQEWEHHPTRAARSAKAVVNLANDPNKWASELWQAAKSEQLKEMRLIVAINADGVRTYLGWCGCVAYRILTGRGVSGRVLEQLRTHSTAAQRREAVSRFRSLPARSAEIRADVDRVVNVLS